MNLLPWLVAAVVLLSLTLVVLIVILVIVAFRLNVELKRDWLRDIVLKARVQKPNYYK